MDKASYLKKRQGQSDWMKRNFSIQEETFPTEMADEVRRYWSELSGGRYEVDTTYCQFYTQSTGEFDPRYIPDDFQYWVLEEQCINFKYVRAFTDKNYLDLLFDGVKMPETLIHCINGCLLDAKYRPVSEQEAVKLLSEQSDEGFIKKLSIESWGGSGVRFADPGLTEDELKAFIGTEKDKNFIIQKLIRQHPDMALFNSSSVNSIRVISMLSNGSVTILSSVVRMGSNGSRVDNFSSGGVCCGIDESGHLKKYCYDAAGHKHTENASGLEVDGLTVPSYDKVCEAVRTQHAKFPLFGIISWDFAVDESGEPVLIEYNVGRGGTHVHQLCNGPLYGDKTEEIIKNGLDNAAWCDLNPPTAPQITSVKLNSNGNPTLSWTPSERAVKYEIYRSVNKGEMKKMFTTKNVSYVNTSASEKGTYHFKVWAIDINDSHDPISCSETVDIIIKGSPLPKRIRNYLKKIKRKL